eukprot:1153646-Pelagomonas_calceolata.AAC.1
MLMPKISLEEQRKNILQSYIYDKPLGRDKRVPPLDEVVDSVETMDFLYNKTDYAHQLREARRADHDSGEEEDSEQHCSYSECQLIIMDAQKLGSGRKLRLVLYG